MADLGTASFAAIALWAFIGYLCGSIPSGLLLAKASGLGDVRTIGSGNIGATNVLRTGSKRIAALTLICDMLKGAVPVLAARYFAGDPAAVAAASWAFIGHVLPVWLRFKGGKGVATYLGCLFAIAWPLALIFIIAWLALAMVFKYSSVSSLAASAAIPVAAHLLGPSNFVMPSAAIAVFIFIAHRANIGRLLRGEESKIRLKSQSAGQ
jgi:glycerol-3-phosphate acyltransferase PlsY